MSASAAAIGGNTLDGLRLGRALQTGILRLLSRQAHLNKINVYPVPDGAPGVHGGPGMLVVSLQEYEVPK